MNSGSGISCQCKSIEIFRRTCSCSLHAVEKKMRIGTSKAHMQCKERTSKGKKSKAANARQAAPNPWMGESVRNAYLYYLTVLFCARARQHIYAACNMFPFYFTFPSSRVSSSCFFLLIFFFFVFFSASSSRCYQEVGWCMTVCMYICTYVPTYACIWKKKSRHSIPHDPSTPAPAQIFPCQQQERIKNSSREAFFQWNVRLSPWSPRISANNYKKNAKGTAIVETTVLNLPWKGKPSNQQQQPNTRDEM